MQFERNVPLNVHYTRDKSDPQYNNYLSRVTQEANKSEWTLHDDGQVTAIDTWQAVIEYCVEVKCYPVVVVYEKQVEPIPSTFRTTHSLAHKQIRELYEMAEDLSINYLDEGEDGIDAAEQYRLICEQNKHNVKANDEPLATKKV